MPRRVIRKIGNRGIVLVLLGAIWLVLAVGLATDPPRRVGLVYEEFPLWVRAMLWAVPAAVALLGAAWKRIDALAWGLLMVPPLERCLSYLVAMLFGQPPLHLVRHVDSAWRGFVVYGALALMVNRCAAGLDRAALWDGRERRWSPKV